MPTTLNAVAETAFH